MRHISEIVGVDILQLFDVPDTLEGVGAEGGDLVGQRVPVKAVPPPWSWILFGATRFVEKTVDVPYAESSFLLDWGVFLVHVTKGDWFSR